MTREEATAVLKEMHDSFDRIHENTNYEIGYEQMTALDIAIEALSQPIVCTDAINREKAIFIVLACSRIGNLTDEEKWNKCANMINKLPSVNRPTGEWINEWKDIDGGRAYGACCSLCHTIGHWGYNFCPNCGADMIGGDDE